MNQNLNKIREDEMRASLSMIEQGGYSNFMAFSTAGVVIKGTNPDTNQILQDNTGSIEGLHNNYHVYVGGFSGDDSNTGHMSCVPVAAFDPVFWIHHCQIDRLFAIWQAVNPSHWFDELPTAGQRALADGNLLPFRRAAAALKPTTTSDGKPRYWTPNQARDPEALGYTYPDVADKSSKSADQLRADFAARYGWSRRLTPFQRFGAPPADMLPLELSAAQVYQYTSGVSSASRFRTSVPIGTKAPQPPQQTNLFAKVTQAAVAAVAPSKKVEEVSPKPGPPQAAVGGAGVQKEGVAHPQELKRDAAPPPRAIHAQAQAQAPLTPKVSHEWYIDAVVER